MIRKIVIPTEDEYILKIPASFIGKKIEVLAFEVEDQSSEELQEKEKKSVEDLYKKFEGLTFDSKGTFTFDRNEATDYEWNRQTIT